MRTWNVVGKYPVYDDSGVITHTDVNIVSTNEGYATFTERLLGDQRNKADKEVLELVHDAYFKSQYADRAMAESVQKVDELAQKSKEFAEQLTAAKLEIAALKTDTIAEVKLETDKIREMVRIVTMTVNEVLENLGVDDDTDSTDDTIEE